MAELCSFIPSCFFSFREVDEEVPEAEDVPPAEEKTVAEGLEASATGLGKPRSR